MDGLKQHISCHQLGHGGRWHRLVTVLIFKNRFGLKIDENVLSGGNLDSRCRGRNERGNKRGPSNNAGKCLSE